MSLVYDRGSYNLCGVNINNADADNFAIMCTKDKCKKANGLLVAILTGNYLAVILNKMSYIHLERLVTCLALCSRRGDKYYVGSKLSRPRWWPKQVKFEDPIAKLRPDVDHHDLLLQWSRTLRNVVECCATFHYGVNQRLRRTALATKQFNGGDAASPLKSYQCFRRFKCKENATNRRKSHINEDSKCEANAFDRVPIVKLHDVVQQGEIKNARLNLQRLHLEPVVKLCDIRRVRKQHSPTSPQEIRKRCKHVDNKILAKAYVALHNICDAPKQSKWTKDDYMDYLNLVQTNPKSSSSMARHTPNQNNKIFRNYNVPISSELGQVMFPTITDNNNALWRLRRLEWFLKESPQVKCEQEYPVVFTQRQNDNAWTHEYKFPKRQYFQMRDSSEQYHRLGLCKPVCVKLERLDLRDPRYAKYLKKVHCRLSQRHEKSSDRVLLSR